MTRVAYQILALGELPTLASDASIAVAIEARPMLLPNWPLFQDCTEAETKRPTSLDL
ncbi:hypothetical protein [Streptomyces sp. NBC_01518]|uniref:hypothetical protein n=1 Tax=Streptomyces sp. NBC_01518 TaxID=2903891 RepID=UPI0038688CFA